MANLIELYGFLDPKRALEVGRQAAFTKKAASAGWKNMEGMRWFPTRFLHSPAFPFTKSRALVRRWVRA
ncbi:MAG TPA: hypothetical protein VKB48_04620 [Candidatus Acidoferrum sp.]|nr:hypothetical protein [Candidatus Acidoferrum sp.]